MLSGGHGEGVSAGDEGRLLYTQHANGDERESRRGKTQTLSFRKKDPQKQSHSAAPVAALM